VTFCIPDARRSPVHPVHPCTPFARAFIHGPFFRKESRPSCPQGSSPGSGKAASERTRWRGRSLSGEPTSPERKESGKKQCPAQTEPLCSVGRASALKSGNPFPTSAVWRSPPRRRQRNGLRCGVRTSPGGGKERDYGRGLWPAGQGRRLCAVFREGTGKPSRRRGTPPATGRPLPGRGSAGAKPPEDSSGRDVPVTGNCLSTC
jgi:hypothetical protein